MHCLYFLCERKFHSRTHVKITRHWKSTLRVLKMAWTIYERNSCARGVINKYLFGEAPPRGSTPSAYLCIIFYENGTPLLLTNGTPFTYLVYV